MNVAIVGGGVLGLTLGYRLGQRGHRVEIFEAAPEIGGLAAPQDYGSFVWDRFYHCILPQDANLVGLLADLGLAEELRWTRTGTGYYARGEFHPMSGNRDFLRFPLLNLWNKLRLGAAITWARKFARPEALYEVSAEEWLTRMCGRKTYEVFWRPLLRAKFGPFHDQVAAVFIYATLVRLFGARSAVAGKENLGYVRGGYRKILKRFRERLAGQGAVIRTGSPVTAAEPSRPGPGCRLSWKDPEGTATHGTYEQVFFTGPTRLARKVAAPEFLPHVERMEREHPTSSCYLGVACLVTVLDEPLTPYYVLNIGDPEVELTGLIEMTNLVAPDEETGGNRLVYLPRYMESESRDFEEDDESLRASMIDRGLKRLFPEFDPGRMRYCGVHRARYVQPLPLVRSSGPARVDEEAPLERPFQILNTSMLRCATLNNNEVVGLVDRLLARWGDPGA